MLAIAKHGTADASVALAIVRPAKQRECICLMIVKQTMESKRGVAFPGGQPEWVPVQAGSLMRLDNCRDSAA